jgi:hypothetical protein
MSLTPTVGFDRKTPLLVLRIMGVPDRASQVLFELLGVENDFARVDGHHGGERDDKVSPILDVDLELGSTKGGHLANGSDLLTPIGDEDLKSDFDVRKLHGDLSPLSSGELSMRGFAEPRRPGADNRPAC